MSLKIKKVVKKGSPYWQAVNGDAPFWQPEVKMENKKVLLGMSGGVDSSVSALLLKKEGYEVIGTTLELFAGSSCCNINTYIDAKNVCKSIGVPHFTYNCKERCV